VPENCCGDPLLAPCGWGGDGFCLLRVEAGDELPAIPSGSLLSLPQGYPLADIGDDYELEIRCQAPAQFCPESPGRAWSLYLEFLKPYQLDDLGLVEEVLEKSVAAGCRWVVAPSLQAQSVYRYRMYALIRLLCDRFGLIFSICELAPVEKSERLNHYLANKKGCCRHPAYRPKVIEV